MTRNPHNPGTMKAGALMCPKCCVEYLEAEVDIDCDGTVLHNVKVLQCPDCGEEQFTPEQHSAVLARIRSANENSKSTQ